MIINAIRMGWNGKKNCKDVDTVQFYVARRGSNDDKIYLDLILYCISDAASLL